MSRQFWMECLAAATASGTAIASSTTETTLIPAPIIPGNYLQDGRCLRVVLAVGYGTTGTPTLTFSARYGPATTGVVLTKSGAIVTSSGVGGGASMTALWIYWFALQVRANGASGNAMTNGEATLYTTGTAAGSTYPVASGSTGGTTPVVCAAADFTADTALTPTALWGTNNAANSIQAHQFTLEGFN